MYQSLLQQSINSLQTLSSDELRSLLAEDEKLDERVDEVVRPLESSKDVILAENRSIAETTLGFEPKMIEHRSRVQELTTECTELGTKVQEKNEQLKSKSDKSNSETVLALLQAAAAESEEESENIVKQFLDSELSAEAFLEQFTGIRKLMHARKLKAEKMTDLVRYATISNGAAMNGRGFGLGLGPYAPPIAPTGFFSPSGAPVGLPYPMASQVVPSRAMLMFTSHPPRF